ncbi:hypothetical protein HanXRQr2_Chr02g0045871 [Helianthus annuus]|uniref:Uncharacterized protein n=1 Tax=Helianthus annuus TaxID=4232 RepID=A0A9K3NY51_HELAN|nr:hypothetical protein HanXRQr2_Chr02g0045871 [Helianthus annuus]KAJ0950211.1 hypothetical protein HanPSC8_Chr02g0045521 [Helianthus annuus]
MVAAAGHLHSAHESARFAHLGAGSQFYWWRLHKKLRVQVTAGKMGRFGDENCHYRFHEHVGLNQGVDQEVMEVFLVGLKIVR